MVVLKALVDVGRRELKRDLAHLIRILVRMAGKGDRLPLEV